MRNACPRQAVARDSSTLTNRPVAPAPPPAPTPTIGFGRPYASAVGREEVPPNVARATTGCCCVIGIDSHRSAHALAVLALAGCNMLSASAANSHAAKPYVPSALKRMTSSSAVQGASGGPSRLPPRSALPPSLLPPSFSLAPSLVRIRCDCFPNSPPPAAMVACVCSALAPRLCERGRSSRSPPRRLPGRVRAAKQLPPGIVPKISCISASSSSNESRRAPLSGDPIPAPIGLRDPPKPPPALALGPPEANPRASSTAAAPCVCRAGANANETVPTACARLGPTGESHQRASSAPPPKGGSHTESLAPVPSLASAFATPSVPPTVEKPGTPPDAEVAASALSGLGVTYPTPEPGAGAGCPFPHSAAVR
mmetsp:Transcript_41098/g.101388  ORF Transcript_41098/g.101388 Transcript_41098/m.101388 type:complete len:369 (+) Transcript_41098:389-1495(+)